MDIKVRIQASCVDAYIYTYVQGAFVKGGLRRIMGTFFINVLRFSLLESCVGAQDRKHTHQPHNTIKLCSMISRCAAAKDQMKGGAVHSTKQKPNMYEPEL